MKKTYSKPQSKLEKTISKNLSNLEKIKDLLLDDQLKNVIGEIIQDFNSSKRFVLLPNFWPKLEKECGHFLQI